MQDPQTQPRQGEHRYTGFSQSLAAGKLNEQILLGEFKYQGVPLTLMVGENPFDFRLPTGGTVELKLDLRSQCTGRGAIEAKTLERGPDFLIQTFTEARVYPLKLLQEIYASGRIPKGGFGDRNYDGRHCAGMRERGIPLAEFIHFLRN
jgi:hypothetical protein